jgi:deoxyribonuclease-4
MNLPKKDDMRFGVAGFPINFFSSQYKKNRDNIFEWLNSLGLSALELQCTYGVRMSDEQAIRYKKLAEEKDIKLTIHAPYYVNLGSKNQQTVINSKNEIIKAFRLANIIGASRIIFHPGGGYGKTEEDRAEGISQIITALNDIKPNIDTTNVKIYPEIGGKVASLGRLDEIIDICKSVDYAYPCIDLAHLHAREQGSMVSQAKILDVLNKIEVELGRDSLLRAHFHMYPVDYTVGGEKIHKAFEDRDASGKRYLPIASDFIEAIKQKDLHPLVICEAYNTQEIGAMLMRDIYFQ